METFTFPENIDHRRNLAIKDFIPLVIIPPFILAVFVIYNIWSCRRARKRREREQNSNDFVKGKY